MCESESKGAAATYAAIYVQEVTIPIRNDSVGITITACPNAQPFTTSALPDTGSHLDAIPLTLFQALIPDVRLKPGVMARTAIGSEIKCLGSFLATVDWQANDGICRSVTTTFYVL